MPRAGLEPQSFLDRNLGSRIIPHGLREAGWLVTTMDERYGFERSQAVADVDWIRESSQRGECIITKDTAIARNPVEARVVHMCTARVITVTNQRVSAATVLGWLITNQAAIMRWAGRTPPPFVLGVYEKRVQRLRLNYP
ncbi:MAG: hypothetical protein LCH96_03945 [Actinobacteria bacterium]|nr:hypothetical protein [Actinomycetota bacterium]